MRKYEITYILRPELGEEAIPGLVEKYSQQIVDQGGQVVNVNNWGKRRFAYELGGRMEGYYVVMRFDSESPVAEELRRVMKLSDDVLRSLVVCVN
ncbi:MAG: 30S ribosomal protein S6 [Candidatus Xenobium sp.]|nr:30S ribosomal protein S6 [Burkholderiales bacterium]